MSNKEINDNNEMLSFDELRKKLGMDGAPAPKKDTKIQIDGIEPKKVKDSKEDFAAQIEEKLTQQAELSGNMPKTVTEEGKTFVDITEQYVKKEEKAAETPETEAVPQKKKIRTFNEIFADFFKGFIPLKKDSVKERIRKVIMDISIVVIIGCAIAFGNLYRQRLVQLKTEEGIKENIIETDNMDENQYNEAWQELFARYPNIKVPEGMNLKYAYLYAVNQDLIGWLKIPNTNLDVQVVQTNDNNVYLKKDFYGKTSRYGCPYLDYRNDPKYLDDNVIIYGHHMPDGLMFSNLDKYKTLEGYKESPVIQFDTLYDTYYFKVFAAFISNAEAEQDNGYIFNYTVTNFSTEEKFNSFIENVRQRSVFNSGISVQPDDKILTLVTCSYEFTEARLVVMGRLLRENEDITVDTSAAELNPSPRYPQAWYTAKGITNPYSDAENWTP